VQARPGQLLIASRHLLDPNFVRSVVLLVQQDKAGVIGLILNRPLEITVAESCGGNLPAAAGLETPLYQGGPCDGPVMVLHRHPLVGGEEVLPGVRLTFDRDEIQRLMDQGHEQAKYFVNYSGWGLEQLETEVNHGAWIVADARLQDVFCDEVDEQWSALMARLTLSNWVDPDQLSGDPSVN
jgi:putative transcriptional regulator